MDMKNETKTKITKISGKEIKPGLLVEQSMTSLFSVGS